MASGPIHQPPRDALQRRRGQAGGLELTLLRVNRSCSAWQTQSSESGLCRGPFNSQRGSSEAVNWSESDPEEDPDEGEPGEEDPEGDPDDEDEETDVSVRHSASSAIIPSSSELLVLQIMTPGSFSIAGCYDQVHLFTLKLHTTFRQDNHFVLHKAAHSPTKILAFHQHWKGGVGWRVGGTSCLHVFSSMSLQPPPMGHTPPKPPPPPKMQPTPMGTPVSAKGAHAPSTAGYLRWPICASAELQFNFTHGKCQRDCTCVYSKCSE